MQITLHDNGLISVNGQRTHYVSQELRGTVVRDLVTEIEASLKALTGPSAHPEADALLLDALVILGAQGVVDAFLACRQREGFLYA